MGKRKYHQIEKSREKPVRYEAESEKKKIPAKEKKVNQERDKVIDIKEKEENYKMITVMKKWSLKTKDQTSKS